jgi:hypothetical protein
MILYRPLLPVKMGWLHPDTVMNALRIYEQDEDLSFGVYGPYMAGFMFEDKLLREKRLHYAFIFNTSSVNLKEINKKENELLAKGANIISDFYGSHWVVLYIDIQQNEINYYDSLGGMPNSALKDSFSRIIEVPSHKIFN